MNWGSLDNALLTQLMNENARQENPLSVAEVMRETVVQSAIRSALWAEEMGLGRDKIILSAKVSDVQDLIAVYIALAERCDYALHLGLTEAGMGTKGDCGFFSGFGHFITARDWRYNTNFLNARTGWGSNTRSKSGARTFASDGVSAISPRGCSLSWMWPYNFNGFSAIGAKIETDLHKNMPVWREKYPGVESLKVAVMGCIVNGPGNQNMRILEFHCPAWEKVQRHPFY